MGKLTIVKHDFKTSNSGLNSYIYVTPTILLHLWENTQRQQREFYTVVLGLKGNELLWAFGIPRNETKQTL